jgi:hypothetical protein
MRRAGFLYVFLGIENVLQNDLVFFRAAAKNTVRENGRGPAENATLRAIDYVHKNKMYVIGGLIVGSPEDTVGDVPLNLVHPAYALLAPLVMSYDAVLPSSRWQ